MSKVDYSYLPKFLMGKIRKLRAMFESKKLCEEELNKIECKEGTNIFITRWYKYYDIQKGETDISIERWYRYYDVQETLKHLCYDCAKDFYDNDKENITFITDEFTYEYRYFTPGKKIRFETITYFECNDNLLETISKESLYCDNCTYPLYEIKVHAQCECILYCTEMIPDSEEE